MRFSQLAPIARAYVLGVYVVAAIAVATEWLVTTGWSGRGDLILAATSGSVSLWLFVVLAVCATIAQSVPVSAPGRQAYYVSPPFFVAAFVLLPPLEVAALLIVVHLGEWLWMARRRSWFAQIFNAATLLISAFAAQSVYQSLWSPSDGLKIDLSQAMCILAAVAALLTFSAVNRGLVTVAIWLGNGISPRQQQILEPQRLLLDSILLVMGLPLAALSMQVPLAVVLGAAPLLLIHRALDLPNIYARTREDDLTQVSTASSLAETGSREIRRAQHFGRPLALLLVDIDALGALNTNHGFEAADAIIAVTARVVQQACRGFDQVGRIGGGQFAVLLPDAGDLDARGVAARIQHMVSDRRYDLASSVDQITITVSIGGAIAGHDTASFDNLLSAAGSALRSAKQLGGNTVIFASATAEPPTTVSADVAEPSEPEHDRVAQVGGQSSVVSGLAAPRQSAAAMAQETSSSAATWEMWRFFGPHATRVVTIGSLLLAAGLMVALAPQLPLLDPLTLFVLVGLVALAETRSLELFDRSTYSISVVPILAASLLLGPGGALLVAPVSVVIRGLRRRSRWYKVMFNASTQIIASALAAAVFDSSHVGLEPSMLLPLLLVAGLAGAVYYLVNTGLLALVVATELRASPLRVWNENFRWLWPQYVVLSGMGLLLALAYHEFTLVGAIAFVVPPLMMQLVAKQYVDRTLHNVRQLRTLNTQLEHQAFHDPLTALPNRTLFLDRLEHALSRRQAAPLAVLFVDLDNFKLINDSLGHEAGDNVLLMVAERLRSCLRTNDTIARLGGDEFTLLLEDSGDPSVAIHTAERIARRLEKPFTIGSHEVFVGASIGITLSRAGMHTPEELLREADVAMYRAKTNGKGCYEVFDRSMATSAMERLALETDLRRAIERRELVLHFQPIVQLETGQIREVEALVRWEHPERGLIPPGLFIPLAEETGLIVPIGQWVLEESCRQAVQWHNTLGRHEPVGMSVNLSGRQLQQKDFVAVVARVLHETGLDPRALKLEITESLAMQDAEATIETLRKLKSLGVHLAIDDFGTGYSSLAYLNRFPIDTLKIDRSFVTQIGSDPESRAIVRTIIGLAETLNLTVTGEGIETSEQSKVLLAQGCNQGQGYLFARPQPAEALTQLLALQCAPARPLCLAA